MISLITYRKRIGIILIACFFVIGSRAQNFNYQLITSTPGYSDINSPTYLSQGTTWHSSYKIPIGFSFSYMGAAYDSVSVFKNSYLVFDNNFNYAFAALGMDVNNQKDTAGNDLSSISYNVEGAQGSRILKIQFKDCGISDEAAGTVNYQIWLYEGTNKIALNCGGNTYSASTLSSYKMVIGLINMNPLQAGQMAFLLNGNPSSPSTSSVTDRANITGVSSFPSGNTLYVFTPNF